jgi:Zinc finger, C3HC4 type (RING finger)
LPSSTAQPRRPIAEEDECPICGEELPAKGVDGNTTDREHHIEGCIRDRTFGASTGTPNSRPMAAEINTATPVVGSFASGSGTRRRTTGAGRMLVYRATEKDCVDEETGDRHECIVCFGEYEVGELMGRLECLCKFHHDCIRRWWDTKGEGSCPTHQLHE